MESFVFSPAAQSTSRLVDAQRSLGKSPLINAPSRLQVHTGTFRPGGLGSHRAPQGPGLPGRPLSTPDPGQAFTSTAPPLPSPSPITHRRSPLPCPQATGMQRGDGLDPAGRPGPGPAGAPAGPETRPKGPVRVAPGFEGGRSVKLESPREPEGTRGGIPHRLPSLKDFSMFSRTAHGARPQLARGRLPTGATRQGPPSPPEPRARPAAAPPRLRQSGPGRLHGCPRGTGGPHPRAPPCAAGQERLGASCRVGFRVGF